MLNSLVQTVATPRKKIGREAPSRTLPRGVMVTKEPSPAISEDGGNVGYMTLTVGAKMPTILESLLGEDDLACSSCSSFNMFRSCSQVFGYESRSSCAANCVGLTKMEI